VVEWWSGGVMIKFFECLEAVDCQIETVGEESGEGGVVAYCEEAVGGIERMRGRKL